MSIQVIATEGELFLTEKEMEGKFVSKAKAADWIDVSTKTIDNWEKAKKILTVDGQVPLSEVVRLMKQRAA